MKTKIAEWAPVGELIGAVAIVVSLVFVGLEIRGNTQATQAATFQEHMGFEIQILSALGTNPEAGSAYDTTWDEMDSLSESELRSKVFMSLATMRLWEGFYLQWRAGTLSDEAWLAREPLIRQQVGAFPSEVFPGAFSGAFQEYKSSIR